MILAVQRHYVLPESVPTAAIAAIFAAAVALWVALNLLKGKVALPKLRAVLLVLRVAAGFAALMAAAQLAIRCLLLTTSWRLWPIALAGSVAVEVLLGLYALERRTVSRRAGLTLVSLRAALVLLVIAMLAQPVLSWELLHEIQRYVGVLIDGSASMDVTDEQRSASEKLRLAEMLSVRQARRPVRLEQVSRRLQALGGELVAVGEDLVLLAGADAQARREQMKTRRAELHKALAGGRELVDRQLEVFALAEKQQASLGEPARRDLGQAKAELARVSDRLEKATRLVDRDNESRLGEDYKPLLELLRGATAALAKLSAGIEPLGREYDEKYYASLSAEQRGRITAATDRSRLELARDVLTKKRVDFENDRTTPALLDRLADGYKVKLYEFAEDCLEGDLGALRAAAGGPAMTAPASAPASAPATRPVQATTRPVGPQRTDLARAIEKITTEMSGKQLAGIVVLTDGRHNGPRRVEPLADQLGLQGVPICSVVMAPAEPPRDAAVISVRAPQTVTERDKFLVHAELKLDGLAGRNVPVALYDAKRQVAVTTVRVPKDLHSYRPRVQFSDEPKGAGLHSYSVRIRKFDNEVFSGNNEYPLTISVTEDRVRLLLLEDRPRWEFRYIKNIFADRDRNVKLQYVITNPDRIERQRAHLRVAASASRPMGQVEATLLPASPQEWMKFDVIVLGDMAPSVFTDGQIETIRKFVTERGGTLIVIAGPNHMPHAFGETPLEEILPVAFEPSDEPTVGALKTGYRIALTAAGRDSTIMFQNVEPEQNLAVWNSVPAVYWRHPSTVAKEAARVLAYAMPPSPPEFLRPLPPEKASDEEAIRQSQARRRKFQRENPLITVHNVAAGRVMMLSFDRTWRLRYRIGDTYHHRFWGQVMRWATADKLRAGTDFVKLGTDKTRYGPRKQIRIRAKIVQPDLAPVVSENVAVKIFAGDRLRLRKKLEYMPDSPGMYEARIDELESGTYRVELDAPEVRPILAAEKVKKVSTEFSVDPVGSAEEVELSANRGLLRRLANRSNGVVLDPHQADQVIEALGPASLRRRQRRELRLWDSWPLLVLIVAIATVEWAMRKRIGLA